MYIGIKFLNIYERLRFNCGANLYYCYNGSIMTTLEAIRAKLDNTHYEIMYRNLENSFRFQEYRKFDDEEV